jgi:hypothetical protein
MLIPNGKYTAKLSGPTATSNSGIVVYETNKGAICAAIPCTITDGPEAGKEFKSTQTIIKSDGAPNLMTIDKLRQVFPGYDGTDPFQLMDNSFEDLRFEITVEAEQGKNDDGSLKVDQQGQPVMVSKISWINPLGGGMKIPEPADRKAVLAKYGSKLRAAYGGTKPSAPKPAAPSAPSAPKAPADGPTATLNDAWAVCVAANPGKSQEELSVPWFETMKEKFGTTNNSELTPHQWYQLKCAFSK